MFLWMLCHAAASPILLDAGSLASPVMDGFQQLHLEGSTDARVTWLQPPTRARTRSFPDPLATDHIEGGTLHIDVPPGTWDLWFMQGFAGEEPRAWVGAATWGVRAGDEVLYERAHPASWTQFLAGDTFTVAPRPVFRPEQTAWDRQIAPRHRWVHQQVDVGPDGLTLSPFGRGLQALIVSSPQERASVEVEIAVANGRRESHWRAFYAPGDSVDAPVAESGPLRLAPLPDMSPAALDQVTWMTDITHEQSLLVGEPWSLRYMVGGGDSPGGWTVEHAAELDIELSEVSWLDAAGHPHRSLRPRPLIQWPGSGWRGQQGVPPILDVRVRAKRPGIHTARITLRRGDETRDITLKVHATEVEIDPWVPAGLYLQVPPAALMRGGEPVAVVAQHLDVLARRGLTAASIRYTFWRDGYPTESPAPVAMFEQIAEQWGAIGGRTLIWADPKVAIRHRWYTDDLPVVPDRYRAPLGDMFRVSVPSSLQLLFHMYEEEAYKRADAPRRAEAFVQALHTLGAPEGSLLAAAPTPADWPVAEHFDIVKVTGHGSLLHEAVARVRHRGASPWAYNLYPGRAGPLLAWAARVDGLMQWHANPVADDPFYAVQHPTRWFHTVLGPNGQTLSTLWLEDFAAGVYDARLLATLELSIRARRPCWVQRELLAVGQRSRRLERWLQRQPSPYREAENLLYTTRAAMLSARPSDALDGAPVPQDQLSALRESLRAILIQLEHHPR